jgi:EAL and modified HD-GYP domain-containing signal transduction protein
MDDIFIGRQPIYDRELGVYAYELLFRAAPDNSACFNDGDQATSNVIVNAFMEIGLDNIVGQRLAFINLTRAFFVDQDNICLPKERVVLELLEHIEPDADVIDGIKRLSAQGYAIALDDFVYHEDLQPLVQLADIVKVDVKALQRDEIRSQVHKLRRHPLKLLAEKVETRDEFDFCLELGFDYFQGYFFAQPQVLRGQRLPNNRLAILRLLSRLQDPDIKPAELEELIVQDVTFSYRILRYVNSAAFSLARKIESVHQAVVILGQQTIKTWTTLLAMSQVDNKPTELVVTAMVRGKMAEALAKAIKAPHPEAFFTVGLFSALDALMDNTMQEILTQLPLAEHISSALLDHKGIHGEVLKSVLAYERGEWEQAVCDKLPPSQVRDCYLSALSWACDVSQQLVKK